MKRLFVVLWLALLTAGWSAFGCTASDGPTNCDEEVRSADLSYKSHDAANQFIDDVQRGQLRQRTSIALNAMVRYAAFRLRLSGHKDESAKLIAEWESGWDTYLLRASARDLGDHAPLSVWLSEKYAMLEFVLGVDICHFFRLDDIKTLNYAIPVVFSCIDNVDVVEYGRHFIPFSGTVVYWASFFACVGGTWGTGFLFCSPISVGAEFITKNWAAPALNEPAWDLACH